MAFADTLKQFSHDRANLPPEVAAERWISIFDQIEDLPANHPVGQQKAAIEALAQLPAPAAWPALVEKIRQRPLPTTTWRSTVSLKSIANVLQPETRTGDANAETPDLANQVLATVPTLAGSADEVDHTQEIASLLEKGQIEQGVNLLRAEAKRAAENPNGPNHDALQLAARLTTIGRLLNHKTWGDEGAELTIQALKKNRAMYNLNKYVLLLAGAGHAPATEAVLAANLAQSVKELERVAVSQNWMNPYGYDSSDRDDTADPAQNLSALLLLYDRVGRHEDVLTLLHASPWWQAGDVKDLDRSQELIEPAARALLAVGRRDDADRLVQHMVRFLPSNDAGYALLLKLHGAEAIPTLDALFADDPFEERPLIWKAQALLDLGRLDEAEAAADKAAAIDPSDGEQGKGDRMRVYAVFEEINAARGDSKKAAFFGSIVKAIRMSEDADDFFEVGMQSTGLKMYREALTQFSNAYCIQSRLAVQLSKIGRFDEAAPFYKRAYQLMPESFGRVESHCFGCDEVFDDKSAQKLAERTFVNLIETEPNKPQVHYLMGYLRRRQNQPTEAARHFLNAARLDPNYLSAWLGLVALGVVEGVTQEQHDEAIFHAIRLDPRSRHGHRANYRSVKDLEGLWHALEAVQSYRLNPPKVLLPLAASAKQKASNDVAVPAKRASILDEMLEDYGGNRNKIAPLTPGEAIAASPEFLWGMAFWSDRR